MPHYRRSEREASIINSSLLRGFTLFCQRLLLPSVAILRTLHWHILLRGTIEESAVCEYAGVTYRRYWRLLLPSVTIRQRCSRPHRQEEYQHFRYYDIRGGGIAGGAIVVVAAYSALNNLLRDIHPADPASPAIATHHPGDGRGVMLWALQYRFEPYEHFTGSFHPGPSAVPTTRTTAATHAHGIFTPRFCRAAGACTRASLPLAGRHAVRAGNTTCAAHFRRTTPILAPSPTTPHRVRVRTLTAV